MLGEIARNAGGVGVGFGSEPVQFIAVNAVGLVVVRCEGDGAFPSRSTGCIVLVEQLQIGRNAAVVAQLVQQPDKHLVLLAENFVEFDVRVARLLQRPRLETVPAGVVVLHLLPLFRAYNGRQLVQVANHEQLHPTERLLAAPGTFQAHIYGI